MKNVFWLIFKQANLLVGDFWKVWKGGERVINLVLSENPGSLASFQTLTFNALCLHFFKPFSMTNGDGNLVSWWVKNLALSETLLMLILRMMMIWMIMMLLLMMGAWYHSGS